MHATLRLVERFDDLLQRQNDDSPYDYQTMFAAGGFFARRHGQKKLKLLKRIDEELRAMLWPGERVTFLTSGGLYSFWEAYFLGLPMYFLNRRALVVTTERLILLQIDSRMKPRELRSHILHKNIADIKKRLLGAMQVKLGSRKVYNITYVPARDRKSLVDRVKAARTRATRQSQAAKLENLCPHCYEVLEGHPTECRHCRGALKSAAKAGLLSLVFPGLGDIYLGHLRFAILEILVATLIWLGVLLPDPNNPITPAERLIVAAVFFILMHGADALTTYYIARKGHYPSGEKPRVAARARVAATV